MPLNFGHRSLLSVSFKKLKCSLISLVDISSPNKARNFIHGSFASIVQSDLDIVVSKVHRQSSEDDVVESLAKDSRCNTINLTHQLFDEMLRLFKDDWKSALGVFRWAQTRPGYEHRPRAYDQMIDILGKMKQMEKMNVILREMNGQDLIKIGSVAKAMRRFAGAGNWEEAVKLFDNLGSFGLVKNTESMNYLLDALCKSNRVDKAREILTDLKPHISADSNTFNILIHGWCKVGRVEEAYWTIQEMRGLGYIPCVISYSIIVKFHCLRGEFDHVYRVLDEMRDRGYSPNVVTHTTVMSCLAKLEKFAEALEIAERAKSDGTKPDVLFYNSLIYILSRVGRVEDAIMVFKYEMSENGIVPNTSTYNTLIAMFCRFSEPKKALTLLAEMGENQAVCRPDAQSYYPLLKMCFRAGKTDDLLAKLLDEMVRKHHISLDLSGYSLLIHGLCRANKCEWAYLLFEEMTGKGLKPRYKTCRLLLDEVKDKHLHDIAERIEDFIKNM